jgi:hypothetical protein
MGQYSYLQPAPLSTPSWFDRRDHGFSKIAAHHEGYSSFVDVGEAVMASSFR